MSFSNNWLCSNVLLLLEPSLNSFGEYLDRIIDDHGVDDLEVIVHSCSSHPHVRLRVTPQRAKAKSCWINSANLKTSDCTVEAAHLRPAPVFRSRLRVKQPRAL